MKMNKKKHQGAPDRDESTESCDENKNVMECSHVNKAVDLGNIKRGLIKTGFKKDCDLCQKNNENDDMDVNSEVEYDMSLWMCLKCTNQACGRARNSHAFTHYQTPHSDSHALCVNTSNWGVWCYDCNDDVNISCKKKLLEAVEYLKKRAESNQRKQPVIALPHASEYVIELSPVNSDSSRSNQLNNLNVPRARGLKNLGNTCFFNSVLQCLGQTPYLLELLEDNAQPGQPFKLPGGKLTIEGGETKELPCLEGNNYACFRTFMKDLKAMQCKTPKSQALERYLESMRPFVCYLSETLAELQSGRAEQYNPELLLSRLAERQPQFGQGDQHDAHELLRHLLEAVKEDDLKRYQAVILALLELSIKTDPASVSEEKKRIIKFYGQQASELPFATDEVFKGGLVSTLHCQNCGHTSNRDEFFLDLSLPISERQQLPPVLRRKAEELDDNRPSKHQLKKEKRAERKKKQKPKSHKILNLTIASSSSLPVADNMSDTESDADIEDNVESSAPQCSTSQNNPNKGMESGYNSEKIDNSSADSNNTSPDMRVDDSGVPSPLVNMLSGSPESIDDSSITNISHASTSLKNSSSLNSLCRLPPSPENSPASSETNIDMGSPVCGHNSPNDDATEEFERPESRLSFVKSKGSDLKADLAKLSLLNDGDSNKITKVFQANQPMDEDCSKDAMMVDNDELMKGACCAEAFDDSTQMDQDEDTASLWTGTMSARYQCEEGECSVQSCLNQFTSCELMTGNNKVTCELCTKRHGGSEKKPVRTNAIKQLLIYSPPAVLILHLKRFQVTGFRPSKVSKLVKFPLVLDLAPFCSKRSQNLPSLEVGQTKVLYSLYGVVEHSGSMFGGHYTAYIKVRPKMDKNDYRWQFLPKNQKNMEKSPPKGAEAEPEVPAGKWFYASDTYVTEVTEAKVLMSQAYLLFYERIL